jgi:hypothetical protein
MTRAERPRRGQPKSEQHRAEQNKPNKSTAEQNKIQQSRAEQSKNGNNKKTTTGARQEITETNRKMESRKNDGNQ